MKDTITYFIDVEMHAHSKQFNSVVDMQLENEAEQLTSPKMIENVCVC